ncbi:hypothetical protein L21SP3_01577 [Sedimentisphaera cyanobacteriorum]|uniref:Uncharacterized protein n=1 Tax=Sedimentisphaera cyanobacteriorum TaxID=1940790 RepID=A0A1Q2HRA2_9BACT|nr:hypothetical protein [Sedimentisphaera cyanobacteriorum]AQQ09765.1 hypothetical protein L21SP3_01577 [Sedimentisphaera cyanobacteriorum]
MSKKMETFIAEIFEPAISLEEAFEKNQLSIKALDKRLKNENCREEMLNKIETVNLLTQVVLAKAGLTAAEKLAGLACCDKEETARKACIDIMQLRKELLQCRQESSGPTLSEEKKAKLLEILAE